MDIHPSRFLRPIEIYNRGNVIPDGTLGQPYGVLRDLGVSLPTPNSKRTISYIFDKEEEELILGNGIAILVPLLGIKLLKLFLLRLVHV